MKRRAYLSTAATATAAGLAGCLESLASGRSDGEYDVGMSSNRFEPSNVEVVAGDAVVWRNTGSRNHTVTAYEGGLPDGAAYFASGGFDSQAAAVADWEESAWLGDGVLGAGETYSHTFEVPGEYQYYCIPHESGGMIATVTVVE